LAAVKAFAILSILPLRFRHGTLQAEKQFGQKPWKGGIVFGSLPVNQAEARYTFFKLRLFWIVVNEPEAFSLWDC
jgi:hypothetical protein